jgi:hypothetical protein
MNSVVVQLPCPGRPISALGDQIDAALLAASLIAVGDRFPVCILSPLFVRIAIPVLLLVPLIIVLEGCSASTPQVYLHSATVQKSTQQTKDDFGKIRVEQYFSDQQKQYSAFAAHEDAAVIDYLVASRNRQLTLLVRTDPVSLVYVQRRAAPTSTLKNIVDSRLEQITGHPDIEGANDYSTDQLEHLRDGPRALLNAEVSRKADLKFYNHDLSVFKERKGAGDKRPTACSQVGVHPEACLSGPPGAAGATADQAYDQLLCDCARIARRMNDAAQLPVVTMT